MSEARNSKLITPMPLLPPNINVPNLIVISGGEGGKLKKFLTFSPVKKTCPQNPDIYPVFNLYHNPHMVVTMVSCS